MGPFPRQIMIACLTVTKVLLYITGALLAILLVVQQIRGDEFSAPLQLGLAAVIVTAMAWAAGRARQFFNTSS